MNLILSGQLGDDELYINNPSAEQVRKAVEDLVSDDDFFIILAPEKPIENCSFMQCILDESTYHIEVRMDYESGVKIYMFETNVKDKTVQFFLSYLLGIVPDIKNWKDIGLEDPFADKEVNIFLQTLFGLVSTDLSPSQVTDSSVFWIYATLQDEDETNTKTAGKWMLFISPRDIDECWDKIIKGISTGEIWCAKTLPASRVTRNVHPTMIYTKDYNDKENVARVLKYLNSVGLKGKRAIYYKADDQTRAGIYSNNSERTWIYSSDDF